VETLDANNLPADLDVHAVLEASAGTGKTYALERVVARLAADGFVAPADLKNGEGIFPKGKNPGALLALTERCILCDRLANAMSRYEDTLLWMWAHENAFRDALGSSKGLCVPHYARLMARAPQRLPARDATVFCEELTRLTVDNLRRVERDLDWFTQKFDYRNQDKPWGDSQDAVERALTKVRGNARGAGLNSQ